LPEGVPVFSRPDSPRCQTDSAHASPNGLALVLQYNCEDTLFARLLNLAGDEVNDTLLPQGYLLNWSPDGNSLIYVHRENPDDIGADIDPLALRSNLYQVDVSSGEAT